MARIGEFTKTRNYARRQRAVGRNRSPYQRGGTFIGPKIVPFFPTRARPWEMKPWVYGRIKAVRKSKRRVKR